MSFKSKTGTVLTQSQIGITHSSVGATLVSNCNSAIDVNVEYYTNSSTTNKPTSTGTYLIWCHKINSSTIVQFATLKSADSALYMRIYNGSWGSWTIVTRPLDVYPVGSIYKSNSNTNPAQYFGGTWQQIGASEPCILIGTQETNPQSRNYTILFSLGQIATKLNEAYGIDTSEVTADKVIVNVLGADWSEANIAPIGSFISSDIYYATLSGSTAAVITVTWEIVYNRELYKFVRTA